MSRKFLVPVGLLVSASDPTGTFTAGDTYFNSTSGAIKTYNGATWVAASGTQGVQGVQGVQGIQGLQGTTGDRGGLPYTFSTTITDADPGTGGVRYNNATISSVTQIFISNLNASSSDVSSWISSWGNSTSTNKGTLTIRARVTSGAQNNLFKVTGVTAATGYYKIDVTFIAGAIMANSTGLAIEFSPSGDLGTQGVQGIQGIQGVQGVQGLQGIQGAQGIIAQTTPPASQGILWLDTTLTGASAGTSNSDRRWTRGSTASAYDDEFNNASLDAAWTRVDASGGTGRATWTEGADSLSLLLSGGDATAELHALVRPYALAVGESIQTYISWSGPMFNYPMAGLVVSDGTAHGSGNQIFSCHIQALGTAGNLDAGTFTGWNTRTNWTDRASIALYIPYHMKLTRGASNVWSVYVSADGVNWALNCTRTLSITPSHIGFAASSWTATAGSEFNFSFEYFRVV